MLITRPQPGADRTARLVAAVGLRPVLAPMLMISPLPTCLPDPADIRAVLVTSANALPALPACWHDSLLLAVGDATAARARAAGFRHVRSAARDAEALARLAIAICPKPGPVLLAVAAGQGDVLAERLRAAGYTVAHHGVYAAQPAAVLPAEALAVLANGSLTAALFFSPATARTFAGLISGLSGTDIAGTDALAMSAATAAPLFPLPWRRIRVASHPNQEKLLALLA